MLARLRITQAWLAAVAGATFLACTALIGNPDLYLAEGDAAASSSGSSSSNGGTSGGTSSSGGPDGGTPLTCPGADLNNDTKNCGRCAHDCLGGSCAAGKCQAIEVAVGVGQPYALGVDDTNVYFSDVEGSSSGGKVYKLPKLAVRASPGAPIMTTSDPLIYDLRVDGTGVYVASGSVSYSAGKGLVEACDPNGNGRRTVAVANVPRGLAIDNTSAYWAAVENSPVIIQRAAKNTVDGGEPPALATPEADGDMVVADPPNLFWAHTSGTIRRCTLPACADKADFKANLPTVSALAVNATALFYGTYNSIFTTQKTVANAQASAFVQNQPQAYSIVADNTDVYWVNTGTADQSFDNGDVRHCPITDGSPHCTTNDGEILATSKANPRVIAMDAKAIYWTVQYEGKVWRLAR